MPLISTSQGDIFVSDHRRDEANFPPLLYIHGAGGSRLDWPGALRRLEGASTLVLDLPGHDKSPGPARKTLTENVSVVLALMDALDIDRAVIAGHSMGGAIAQTLALSSPERLAGLILVATGARLKVHPDILGRIMSDLDAVAQLLSDWYWGPSATPEMRMTTYKTINTLEPEVLYHDYLACDDFDVRERLGEIRVPVLVISGTHDRMTPLRYGEYLRDHLPNAHLVTVEQGGHLLALEQSEFVASAIRGWLVQHFSEGESSHAEA